MNNNETKEMNNAEQISCLLAMLDDNLKLYPEYKANPEFFKKIYLDNKNIFCDNIATIIFQQMNYEENIDLHFMIGVYMYIKFNNPQLTFAEIVDKMFDKTGHITQIKAYMKKING